MKPSNSWASSTSDHPRSVQRTLCTLLRLKPKPFLSTMIVPSSRHSIHSSITDASMTETAKSSLRSPNPRTLPSLPPYFLPSAPHQPPRVIALVVATPTSLSPAKETSTHTLMQESLLVVEAGRSGISRLFKSLVPSASGVHIVSVQRTRSSLLRPNTSLSFALSSSRYCIQSSTADSFLSPSFIRRFKPSDITLSPTTDGIASYFSRKPLTSFLVDIAYRTCLPVSR